MKEIEIKLSFDDKEKIIDKLISLGAKPKEKYELRDKYYSRDSIDVKNSNSLLRVRKKGVKSELTFKGKAEDKEGVWNRVEITNEVEDFDKMCYILEKLSFNVVLENSSFREYWDVNGTELVFVFLTEPIKLEFIEIEGSSEESVKLLTDKLGNLVKIIGEEYFKVIDEARKSK